MTSATTNSAEAVPTGANVPDAAVPAPSTSLPASSPPSHAAAAPATPAPAGAAPGAVDTGSPASTSPATGENSAPGESGKKISSNIKKAWSNEEDATLLRMIEEHGAQNWSTIASHLEGRVGKQCRERWFNHLCPEVKKGDWTAEEDRIIMESVKEMGTCWSKIVKLLPGRTDNAIKNRYNSTMRKNLRALLKPKPPPPEEGDGEPKPKKKKKKSKAPAPDADADADGLPADGADENVEGAPRGTKRKTGGSGGKGKGAKRPKQAGASDDGNASPKPSAASALAIAVSAVADDDDDGVQPLHELSRAMCSPLSEPGSASNPEERERLRALLDCSTPQLELAPSGGRSTAASTGSSLLAFGLGSVASDGTHRLSVSGAVLGGGGGGGGFPGVHESDLLDAADASADTDEHGLVVVGRAMQLSTGTSDASVRTLVLSPSDSPTTIPAGAMRRHPALGSSQLGRGGAADGGTEAIVRFRGKGLVPGEARGAANKRRSASADALLMPPPPLGVAGSRRHARSPVVAMPARVDMHSEARLAEDEEELRRAVQSVLQARDGGAASAMPIARHNGLRPGKIDLAAAASVGDALGRALWAGSRNGSRLTPGGGGGTPLDELRDLDSAALVESLMLSPALTPGALQALERHLAMAH